MFNDRFVLPYQHTCKTHNSLPKPLHELFIPKTEFNSRSITCRRDILKLVQKKPPLRSTVECPSGVSFRISSADLNKHSPDVLVQTSSKSKPALLTDVVVQALLGYFP
jgi:hypothetical protein